MPQGVSVAAGAAAAPKTDAQHGNAGKKQVCRACIYYGELVYLAGASTHRKTCTKIISWKAERDALGWSGKQENAMVARHKQLLQVPLNEEEQELASKHARTPCNMCHAIAAQQ